MAPNFHLDTNQQLTFRKTENHRRRAISTNVWLCSQIQRDWLEMDRRITCIRLWIQIWRLRVMEEDIQSLILLAIVFLRLGTLNLNLLKLGVLWNTFYSGKAYLIPAMPRRAQYNRSRTELWTTLEWGILLLSSVWLTIVFSCSMSSSRSLCRAILLSFIF